MTNDILNFAQMQILHFISEGKRSVRAITKSTRITKEQIQQELQELEHLKFIKRNPIFQNYSLTISGFNLLEFYDYNSPRIRQSVPTRTEIKHTSNMKTGFGLIFGGILGGFFAWMVISMICSTIIWLSYILYLKQFVPSSLLPYIPFDNFLLDLVISLVSSAMVFLPLRKGSRILPFGGK